MEKKLNSKKKEKALKTFKEIRHPSEIKTELGIKRVILWEKTVKELVDENKELSPLQLNIIFTTKLQISLLKKIFDITQKDIDEYKACAVPLGVIY